jgi:hypothetical protein
MPHLRGIEIQVGDGNAFEGLIAHHKAVEAKEAEDSRVKLIGAGGRRGGRNGAF